MDAIERTERIRMATQAREAIAQNESRRLPVPKQWRAWATVDAGLLPSEPSLNSVPSVFTSEPEAPDSS
jgi:hypothetical protein